MNDATRDSIRKAADHIERYGLWKGAPFPEGTSDSYTAPACAIGALSLFGVDNFDIIDQIRRGLGIKSLAEWNDHPTTTKEMVVEGLRKAADYVTG